MTPRHVYPLLLLAAGTLLPAGGQVVINEIHYDPADETSRAEFVELLNTGDAAVDLSGWQLADAVDFTFAAGTSIPAGSFLVVAEDPATLLAVHGAAAVGPWEKGLSNEGETVTLMDGAGTVIDEVSYQAGFPWPTGARGGGGSMELVNPALDNDLGGSWRTSGSPPVPPENVTYVPAASTGWHFRKGWSEASSPVDQWRGTTFTEDGSWLLGRASIGYGDGDDNTELSDMRYGYTTVYLRHTFTVDPQNIPSSLTLRIYVDDGAVVWINGTEVARVHAPAGELAHDATGENHEAGWEEITLPQTNRILFGGTNVLAVHALNQAADSSDFSIDAELRTPDALAASAEPTPGRANSSFSAVVPPQVRQVEHSPQSPAPGEAVVVTAKITDPDGVGAVALRYQVVEPGHYIRRTDPAYETEWTELPMTDDGTGGDAVAGDDVYTATVPGTVQAHRRLVRYRVICEDGNGTPLTVPYPDDEQPNFAWFVYGAFPDWTGSFKPGSGTRRFGAEMMDDLPVYQLIADETDVTNSQYNGGFDGVHMTGTLVYDGVVYDHVEFENRGEGSTYVAGKNKWRFHFNRARRLQARDDRGRKYASKWTKLNLNACASPWAAVNRGMAGLDEAVSFRLYGLAGVPSPRTHYLSFRVVDAEDEVNRFDPYDGDLWGLYLAVEQPNGSYLDDRGLADGNVYKIEGDNGDKKEQGDTQTTDSSDWTSFHNASNSAQTEAWWRTHMDMPDYYSMRAMNRYSGNVDIRFGYNHYFYHEPTTDRWVVMPWDLDMMFIAETHQAGVIRQQNSILNHPQLALEFRNRCREILDLMATDASPVGGQIGQLLDEYAQIVNPTGQTDTWADLDAFLWNYNPRTNGDPDSHFGQTNHKGNFFYSPYTDSRFGGNYVRTLVSQDHEGFVRHITDYLTDTYPGANWSAGNGVPAGYGFEYLKAEAADPSIPATPTLADTGDPEHPVDALSFQSGAFSDPNGNGTFAGMRWRIAEIAAPGVGYFEVGQPRLYEIQTVHEDAFTTFAADYTLPAGIAVPGHTYRVRVQHVDTSGRTSHWSDPVEFTASGADVDLLAENLVVSEIMYHPADPTGDELLVADNDGEFEFLELLNVSETETLDLSALSFTDGIEFDFSAAAITTLAPGGRLVIVSNLAAFEARYGSGLPVAGEYGGALSNSGEALEVSYALTTPVIGFSYDDGDPWPTEPDGGGVSLVLVDPTSHPDPALPESWQAGAMVHGTPGAGEALTFAAWSAGQFSAAELADPAISGPEADPDHDGLANLLEFALGTTATVSDASGTVVGSVVSDGGEDYLALGFRQRNGSENLAYSVERSEDLGSWAPAGGIEISRSDLGDGFDAVVVRSGVALAGGPEFLRLKVVEP
ncbi:lamin tail domain-containing protein [Haloferula sargassicola]|uniref:LTD domain-containing protein n=1 Tax=Haloferula sargassicola TaxID=490096 RepID=A0ABP9UHW6_9BACT